MIVETTTDLPLFSFAKQQAEVRTHRYSGVLNLLKAGLSIREALRITNVNRSGFYRHMEQDERLRSLVNELAPKFKPGRLAIQPMLTGPNCPHVQDKITLLLKHLRQGMTLRSSCKLASLSDTTVYKWKREHLDFAYKIDQAHKFDSSGNFKTNDDLAHNQGRVELGLLGPNHLYIIRAEGCDLVKVGTSRKPSKRLKGLQTGSPLKLTLHCYFVGAAYLEGEIHKSLTLKGLYSHGEWFHKSCISLVRKHIEGHIRDLSNHLQQKIVSPHPRQDHHISGAGENPPKSKAR